MRFVLALGVIVFLAACAPSLDLAVFTQSDQFSCEAAGGVWQLHAINPDYCVPVADSARDCRALNGVWSKDTCAVPYPDAGKACSSSNECLGLCITSSAEGIGGVGQCQETTVLAPCENAVENPECLCLYDDVLESCEESAEVLPQAL